ncbi:MAG: nitroreductase family protein [Propionibacteriaceae bacterium]|nr:nitroreductase family protein [Propionibacteriaceae bacterium]
MTTCETLEVIARRYACRDFQDTSVPTDLLKAIVEAGLHAPSAKNRQPWRMVVVTDKAELAEIDRVGMNRLQVTDTWGYQRMVERGGRLIYNAAAMIIIVTEELDSPFPVSMDAGIVASHLVLAATALGLDSCIAALPKVAFTGSESLMDKYIPEGFDFSVSVLLGYAVTPGAPHEPDFSKVTYA